MVGLTGSASSPNGGERAPTWGKPTQVAKGEAHRGVWRMNESDYRWVDDPTLDVTSDGEVAVAWADQSRHDIFFQRFGTDGKEHLSLPTNISRSPETFSWLPRVVVARDEPTRVYVLWQEIVFSGGSHGGEIFFARSLDGGHGFSEPANLSNSRAGDGKGRLDPNIWDNGSLDLAKGPKGELYAAWTEYEGALWLRRSTDGGQSFSSPAHVAGSEGSPARGPALAVAADGTLHVAWAVGESATANIQLASSTDGGASFSSPRGACESVGHSDAPKLAVTPDGALHLAYAQSDAGPGRSYHIRHARQGSGAARFGSCKRVPAPVGEPLASAHYPQLSQDARGRLYLSWEGYRSAQERPQWLVFTSSADGGEHFASPSVVPAIAGPALGFNGSQQGGLMKKLAVNEAGRIAVVNSTFRPNVDSQVWLLPGELASDGP
jgi:hypothetical protein